MDFVYFWQFLTILVFLGFLLIFFYFFFLDIFVFSFNFSEFLDFFWIFPVFEISFKVTKITSKSYQGYYLTPKVAKNGPKQHIKFFFPPKKSSVKGRSPLQELEVGLRSGPYLLVSIMIYFFLKKPLFKTQFLGRGCWTKTVVL